ncbi:Uncharacterised protein [[Clostridium] sordellii]|uniref:CD1375 family protein n=1 Tax=Paraclostridium sordellii TaxID=1505 RepID=UPI0005DFDE57|nr:CD1375 family protein [Paeniclostridium sordellii]CEQ01752.1 Uncharacterised protein [[Clostridium] sordellii] [Paeniclostridium sordellii]
MKYYFYNELGEVTTIYFVEPPNDMMDKKYIQSDKIFEDREGFYQEFKVNLEALELICEYKPIPLSMEDKVEQLKKENSNQDALIDTCLLATDEMFMMLEPLLPQVMALKGGESKMVDMYVAMVIRGLKTIDEVPARYRQQVKNILDKLEK